MTSLPTEFVQVDVSLLQWIIWHFSYAMRRMLPLLWLLGFSLFSILEGKLVSEPPSLGGKREYGHIQHSMNFYYHYKYFLTGPLKNKDEGVLFSPPPRFGLCAAQSQPWSQSEAHPEGPGVRYVSCFQKHAVILHSIPTWWASLVVKAVGGNELVTGCKEKEVLRAQ